MNIAARLMLRAAWQLGMFCWSLFVGIVVFTPVASVLPLAHRVIFEETTAAFGGSVRLLVVGLGALIVSLLSRRQLRRMHQRERDGLAAEILAGLRAGRPPAREFFIYLRAFETTGHLRAPLFAFDLSTFGLARLRTMELESFVGAALIRVGALVALGQPGENIGVGRVSSSDETWQEDIVRLADRARAVLLIPSQHVGTLWEIEHLQQAGLLGRTIWVMPPESRSFNWRAHWSPARKALESLGLRLPEYQDLGLVFTLGLDGGVREMQPFSLMFQRGFRRSVLRLLDTARAPREPQEALQRSLRRARWWRWYGRLDFTVRGLAVALFAFLLVSAGHMDSRAMGPPSPTDESRWSMFLDRLDAATVIAEGQQTLLRELESSPLYKQRVRELSADRARQLRVRLVNSGVSRLGDNQPLTVVRLFAQVLERSDVATCGAIARGTIRPDQMEMALTRVDDTLLESWFGAQQAAALAELQGLPRSRLPAASRRDLERRFEESLPQADLDRRRALIANPRAHSVEDDCWLQRQTYGGVKSLRPPDDLAWARLLAAAIADGAADEPVTPPTSRALEEMHQSPLYQASIRGLSTTQADAVTKDLISRGFARLDDTSLMDNAAGLAELLTNADDATCAAIALDQATPAQINAVWDRLEGKKKEAYFDTLYRAALAELKHTPPQPVRSADLEAAKDRFITTAFTSAESRRLNRMKSGTASPSDHCWLLRKKYVATTTLEEPYNHILARALAEGRY